ncbi:E3 ubiquitin-protein ligase [Perilla frutescens var. frutescens]|nr:E3 ubiquitin-protein ligase [Perilla frutescens var. frutescens]
MAPSSNSLKPSHDHDHDHLHDHNPPNSADHHHLETLLESARPFLRGELHAVDKDLPRLVSVLQAAGAGECWHKHGSFLDHLIGVYRILKMWKAPDAVCLCGLFHSAYSNSYVNLAIFPPSSAGRDTVRAHVGAAAERLIHLFCIVPRQSLIHDFLLFKYTDAELVNHLRSSEITLEKLREGEEIEEDESWRAKLRSICPAEGITVKHIKTGEDLLVSRRIVATFLLMTIADFSDQLFSFQDVLFDNHDGRLDFSGNNTLSLWPGDGKPGLWMNSASRMAALYSLMVREEEIYITTKSKSGEKSGGRDEELELVIPPILEGCRRIVDGKEQIEARDLYWEAVCGAAKERAEEMLVESVRKNPFVGESYVVLGQIYLGKGEFEEAEKAAARGLRLLVEWGSPWDKRMTWQGWVAWCRVLLMKAKDRSWPQTSWVKNSKEYASNLHKGDDFFTGSLRDEERQQRWEKCARGTVAQIFPLETATATPVTGKDPDQGGDGETITHEAHSSFLSQRTAQPSTLIGQHESQTDSG